MVDLPNKDIYCLKDEVPVVGRLMHFLSFSEVVIQADHWVLEVIHYGYSIEMLWIPQFQGVRNTVPIS